MLSAEVRRLQNTWQRGDFPKHLEWLEIDGIRGWRGERIDFKFPIVCISGNNGIGKSTILQASAGVYQNEIREALQYYASDFFPDTPWERVTAASIRASIRQGEQTINQTIRKPSNRWRGNPDRARRSVAFLDLRRTQPLYSKRGYTQITRGASREGSTTSFPDNQRQRFAAIIGKGYTSVRTATVERFPDRPVPVVELGDVQYSGFHQGAGEATVADLVGLDFPQYSLVLIDEIETSLHPRAQRRLIRDLATIARQRKIQFIVTTHSPYVMEELPSEARVHVLGDDASKRVVFGVSPEFALTKMDDENVPELEVYCEDVRAKTFISEIVAHHDLELLSRLAITPYGSASVGKSLGIMREQNRFRMKTCVVLDGDQDPSPGCLLLPGNDAPEIVVFQEMQANEWCDVASLLGRSHSDLVDAANLAVTTDDHHLWVKEVADRLVVGGDELWRAMCRKWCEITAFGSDCGDLTTAIRETIDQ